VKQRWLPDHAAGLAALGNPFPRVAGLDASVALNYFSADALGSTTVRRTSLPNRDGLTRKVETPFLPSTAHMAI
jgi:hypothetical protein